MKECFLRTACGTLATVLFAAAIAGQAADLPAVSASTDAPLSAETVTPGLYRIGGAGALVRLSDKGLVIVDSGRPGAYRPLMTELQRIAKTAEPAIGALVLTASTAEQAGNVAQFVEAGVPVIVQQRALARLAAIPDAAAARAPTAFVTYDSDYLLRVGRVQIEIEHVGRGRTEADSIIVFRDLRVVAIGELFTAGTPEPDCSAGGSFAGWAAAIDHLLWSDFDVAVPSRGAPVGKPELMAFKAKLEALAARAASSPSGPSDCLPPK
jgi:glyoxylase-like metal-dependent hydrolase (beta-lactamase superfamily II)